MATFTNTDEVEIRERRLGSVLKYEGELDNFLNKSRCRSLCSKYGKYEQCGSCGQVCATTMAIWVQGSAVINHSPVGCGLSSIEHAFSVRDNAQGQDRSVQQMVTNIQEKDTIYGATRKLEATIDEAVRRFDPTVIFIMASCVSGIIGEDLESVANAKEDEYGIPVVPIYCEGFKSRMWSTGFDAAYHGILRKLVHEPEKKQNDLVNVFNFIGQDRLKYLLEKMGLRANYVIPFASLEDIQNMAEAACSVQFCDTLSSYITTSLEEKYGVKKVKNAPPFGLKWTDEWLLEIGEYTGKKEEALKVIEEEHEKIMPELLRYRSLLKGKRAYIMTGDSFAYHLANAAKDLGLEVVGITSLHHDQVPDGDAGVGAVDKYLADHGNLDNVHVCAKQPYQSIKLIKKANPDILICRHVGIASIGASLGIPVVPEGDKDYTIAYDGLIKLGKRIELALKSKQIIENVSKHSKLPYTDWWLEEEKGPYYLDKEDEKKMA